MKNLFEHTSAYWAKYASYEWRKAADGKEYLLPTADAKASVYNTMPLADQLVLDAVNIGLLVIHKSPEKKIKAAIHTFVCNYGLLGMMTAFPTTPNFVEYEKVYLPKNQFIRQETMDTLTYMKFFFPFKMPDFRKRGIESIWNVSGSDRDEAALSLTFSDDPRAKAISFMRSYGEPYEWLKEVFLDWAFTFMSTYLYYEDRDLSPCAAGAPGHRVGFSFADADSEVHVLCQTDRCEESHELVRALPHGVLCSTGRFTVLFCRVPEKGEQENLMIRLTENPEDQA